MKRLDEFQIDRQSIEIVQLTARPDDRAYWLSKTPEERFEALELLRQIAYSYDPATARLQRVLEVTKLK
jgi:hypothetical protein